MAIVVDTTVGIAVLLDEPAKARILELTTDEELVAPASLPWEVGNACSAMFKRRRLTEDQALAALRAFDLMGIRLDEVPLAAAVRLCASLRIYACDAYMIECARSVGAPLLTLDRGLVHAARSVGVRVIEAHP